MNYLRDRRFSAFLHRVDHDPWQRLPCFVDISGAGVLNAALTLSDCAGDLIT
jgi:hypothetical protein